MKSRIFVAVLVLVAVVIYLWPDTRSWTEEVELSSGEVISVARHEKYRSNTELGGWRKNVWIVTSKLVIGDARIAPPPAPLEASELFLMRVDYDAAKRQWFVIGALEACTMAQPLAVGTWAYYEYIFENGRWSRHPVRPEHIGLTSNLLISKSLADESEQVELADKRRKDANVGLAGYLKRVLPSVPC
jgi:hypothetical protein